MRPAPMPIPLNRGNRLRRVDSRRRKIAGNHRHRNRRPMMRHADKRGASKTKGAKAMKKLVACLIPALAGFIFNGVAQAADQPSVVCEREMIRAAKLYAVPLGVLYAVGLTETGR